MSPQQRLQQLSMLTRESSNFYEQAMSNGRYQEAAKHMADMLAQITESAAHLRGSYVTRIERGEVVMGEPKGDQPAKPEKYWDGVDVAAYELIVGALARLPEPESRHYDLGGRPRPQQQRQDVGRVATTPTNPNKPGGNTPPK